jgi:uncharacterized protein (TIGR02217 family)
MSFFETEFPTKIAFQAQGGPTFSTTVNIGFSGHEQRNRNWAFALGQWKIDLAYKDLAYFQAVYNFWLAVGGRADAFRFKDAKDYSGVAQMCDEVSPGVYQLQKTYTAGSRSYVRKIVKPITSAVKKFDETSCADTVTIYDGGSPAVGATLDETTGLITGLAAGHTITADFEFHFPARFDMDNCQAVVEPSDVAGGKMLVSWPGVQIIETRSYA